MLYPDGSSCPVCNCRYAHLTGCSVPDLHAALDEMIGRCGIDWVMIVDGRGGKIKGHGMVQTSVEVFGAVYRGVDNRAALEEANGGPLPER